MRERELKLYTLERYQQTDMSLPMREHELKQHFGILILTKFDVAPHAGARIETCTRKPHAKS